MMRRDGVGLGFLTTNLTAGNSPCPVRLCRAGASLQNAVMIGGSSIVRFRPPSGPAMQSTFAAFSRLLLDSLRDLAPIIFVVGFFQIAVLQQPFPDLTRILFGLLAVIVGLALFIRGLDICLFPIGESMAGAFAEKGNVWWILAFAFALGFGTTVAEPALIAVAGEAASVKAAEGGLSSDPAAQANYALGLRYTVAVSVGFALVIGVLRILKGWPIQWIIMSGYFLIVILTQFAPREIIGIAYDSGGVTTSTITVPLVTALGIGLSTVIRGRNPLIDGFGLIAFASLTPILFVLLYGMVV
jgi:hypothetical protein